MRIRNEGKRTFFFNGGKIEPKEVVDIRDEHIATALLKNYPNELVCLDNLNARVVEAEEKPAEVEPQEEVVEPKKTARKSKK